MKDQLRWNRIKNADHALYVNEGDRRTVGRNLTGAIDFTISPASSDALG